MRTPEAELLDRMHWREEMRRLAHLRRKTEAAIAMERRAAALSAVLAMLVAAGILFLILIIAVIE